MNEYNKNNPNNEHEEPTTPFQTPVRGADEGGTHSDNTTNPYRKSSGNTGNTENPYSYGGNSDSYEQHSKYSGWDTQKKRQNQNRKTGGNNNAPKFIIAALVIAAIGFTGGMMAGTGINLPAENSQIAATEKTENKQNTGNSNAAKLQISESKKTGAGESADDGQTSTDIYKTVSPSICSILVDDIRVGSKASGSGVIMSKDGYVITNHHVVEGGNKYTVVLSDKTKYEAELIGSDEQTDLAVLKIDPKEDLPAAEFGHSDELQVGDKCYAIGSPGGVEFQNTFTGGYISAINRNVTINDRVMTLIQTDSAINPGSSGGALINSYSQVIGITNSKLGSGAETSYEGMGFAIPMNTVQEIVDQLIANGKVIGRPAIGISGYNISETAAQYYDVPQGVLISDVNEESDAYKQGVQTNDIITAVDGEKIANMEEINAIKEKHKAGDVITLTVYRSGKTRDYKITLMDETELNTQSNTDDNSYSEQSGGYGYYYGDNGMFGY